MSLKALIAAIMAALGMAGSPPPAPQDTPPAVVAPAEPSQPAPAQPPANQPAEQPKPTTPAEPTPTPGQPVPPTQPQVEPSLVVGQDKAAVWQFCTTNHDTGEVFAWLRAWGTAPATGEYSITAVPLGSSADGVTLMDRQHYQQGQTMFKYIQLDNKRQYNIAIVTPGQAEPIVYRLPVDCRQ